MKRVVTIGSATQDLFILYKKTESLKIHSQKGDTVFLILEEGSKVEVEQLTYSSGGGATNSAVSFKRLGFDVSSFFKIGSDDHGNAIQKELTQEGIDISQIVIDPSQETGRSFILPTKSGNRVILAYRGINAQLTKDDIPYYLIKQADQLYITSLSHPASHLLPEITAFAKKHNIPVANNPGKSQLEEGAQSVQAALGNIDILIMNRTEATQCFESLTGQKEFDLKDYFKTILERGPRITVVTDGAHGVYAAHGDQYYFHPSMPPEKIISTVGAGDSFGSCFVAQLLHGKSIQDALVAGIANAGSVISHIGAKTGLLTQNKLKEKLESIDSTLLQQFPLV